MGDVEMNLQKRLVIGVSFLALLSSNVMADKKDKPLCKLATLKGAYHFFIDNPPSFAAGQYMFDGAGNGDLSYTTQWIDKDKPDSHPMQHFTYSTDPTEYCKFIFQGFSTGDKVLYTNPNGYSGSILGVSISTGQPITYEIFRGPKTPARH